MRFLDSEYRGEGYPILPDDQRDPPKKLAILTTVLTIALFVSQLLKDSPSDHHSNIGTPPIARPVTRPECEPSSEIIDSKQQRHTDPPPEKNPYNPEGEPLN